MTKYGGGPGMMTIGTGGLEDIQASGLSLLTRNTTLNNHTTRTLGKSPKIGGGTIGLTTAKKYDIQNIRSSMLKR